MSSKKKNNAQKKKKVEEEKLRSLFMNVELFIQRHTSSQLRKFVSQLIDPRSVDKLCPRPNSNPMHRTRVVKLKTQITVEVGTSGIGYCVLDPSKQGTSIGVSNYKPIWSSTTAFAGTKIEDPLFVGTNGSDFPFPYAPGRFINTDPNNAGGWQSVSAALYVKNTSSSITTKGNVTFINVVETGKTLDQKTPDMIRQFKGSRTYTAKELHTDEVCTFWTPIDQLEIEYSAEDLSGIKAKPKVGFVVSGGLPGDTYFVEIYLIQAYTGKNVQGKQHHNYDGTGMNHVLSAIGVRGTQTHRTKHSQHVKKGMLAVAAKGIWELGKHVMQPKNLGNVISFLRSLF